MIKDRMLGKQRGQRIGYGSASQARQIRVIGVQPDRNLPLAVTEDHSSFVVTAASSHSGTGAEQLGASSSRPVNGRGVGRGCRMPWIGINVIQPP